MMTICRYLARPALSSLLSSSLPQLPLNWYRPISQSLVDNFTSEYHKLIFSAYQQGIIDCNTWKFLNVKEPKTPMFYALPKLHKSLNNPPGRPIVSGCQCLTENASALVDKYLGPHVISLSSYVKDTIHLLCILEGKHLPHGVWLVALDVKSLYNTIPHKKALKLLVNSFKRGAQSLIHMAVMFWNYCRSS